MKPWWPVTSTLMRSLSCDDELASVECLGVLRPGLDAADAEEAPERLRIEPLLRALAREGRREDANLGLDDVLGERHVDARRAEIAVPFRNFVLEHQRAAKGLPGELGDEAMVLVQVVALVGEHEVGRDVARERGEVLFDLRPYERKEAV